ncbi:MAG: acyl-CoA dehydrogenase family protein [Hyphomicrobiaceae bacterium]|nr:acyl-CoA dehydrogenase family protein [Hyphomicrobiaceae bacterium]
MEFGLSDEQRMLEQSLRGYLAEHLPMEKRRAIAAGGGHDGELWQGLAGQGLPGLMVSERHGGSGLEVLDAAIAAVSLGYHAVPGCFAAGLVMAPLALRVSGTEAQQAAWLPRIASGDVRTAVGFAGHAGQTGRGGLTLDGERLSGTVTRILDGAGATHVLVYLADGRAAIVALDAPGVAAAMVKSLDRTRPLMDVAFENATVTVLNAANDAAAARTRVLDAGRIMLAADTLGAAQAMIDQAVAYAKERVQFGRVIGSFQGVKHTLADLVTMLEPCHSLVWFAAHAQDALPEEARVAALQAKAHLDDVGREVARLATEVHGGMGFTDLLGLHYWFKRIDANRQLLGTPELLRHEAAVVQGWAG